MDMDYLIAPLILFIIIVAPIWIVMHYRTMGQKLGGVTQEEHEQIERLVEVAGVMEERIETLEKILDSETPDWRKQYDQ